MRASVFVVGLFVVLSASALHAEGSRVIVKTVGAVPAALPERMVWWLTDAIGSTTNAGALSVRKVSPAGIEKAARSVGLKDSVVLVLAEGLAHEKRLFWNEKGAAVVNVSLLKPAGAETDASREVLARRVEKASVHAVANALGMVDCPYLYCALYRAESFDELDKQARGLCPPCMEKLGKMVIR